MHAYRNIRAPSTSCLLSIALQFSAAMRERRGSAQKILYLIEEHAEIMAGIAQVIRVTLSRHVPAWDQAKYAHDWASQTAPNKKLSGLLMGTCRKP